VAGSKEKAISAAEGRQLAGIITHTAEDAISLSGDASP